jgi:hypothetical protein
MSSIELTRASISTLSGIRAALHESYTNVESVSSIQPLLGNNNASGIYSVVAGGCCNTASEYISTISGGYCNTATCYGSTVGGGYNNSASGAYSSIAGGCYNKAYGCSATIGGGTNNTVGRESFICEINITGGTNISGTYIRPYPITGDYYPLYGSDGYIFRYSDATTCEPTNQWRYCSNIDNAVTYANDNNLYPDNWTSLFSNTHVPITSANNVCTPVSTYIGAYSTVGGGYNNCASGRVATIGGGSDNTASGYYGADTVGGGICNTTSGYCASTVSGGYCNYAGRCYSTVSGGYCNSASGYCSTIGGGNENCARGSASVISGGCCNFTKQEEYFANEVYVAELSAVMTREEGGYTTFTNNGDLPVIYWNGSRWLLTGKDTEDDLYFNTDRDYLNSTRWYKVSSDEPANFIGGYTNITWNSGSKASFIGGGYRNCADSCLSVIGGGRCNYTNARYGRATIAGGHCNEATGCWNPTVGGGSKNIASGSNSTVSGGYCNRALGYHSNVAGGTCNTATGRDSTIAGGRCNVSGVIQTITLSGGIESSNGRFYGQWNNDRNGWCFCNFDNQSCIIPADNKKCWNLYDDYEARVTYYNTNNLEPDAWHSCVNNSSIHYKPFNTFSTYRTYYTTVGGGSCNVALEYADTVSGGYRNTTSGYYDGGYIGGNTVAGGGSNLNVGALNTVSGGYRNCNVINCAGTISGGCCNTVTSNGGVIAGGSCNFAYGINAVISGGCCNGAYDTNVTIGGGECNFAYGYGSTISGGLSGTASGYNSTIGGGSCNCVGNQYDTVAGGYCNVVNENIITTACGFSFIGAGCENVIDGKASVITGGHFNCITGDSFCSSILGGHNNVINNLDNTHIIGSNIIADNNDYTYFNNTKTCGDVYATGVFYGNGNGLTGVVDYTIINAIDGMPLTYANAESTSIKPLSGNNFAPGQYASVLGGINNKAEGYYSFVGGGENNCATNIDTTVVGGRESCATACKATVGGGGKNCATGQYSVIAGGGHHAASGRHSTVGGGRCNIASGDYSVIAGGGLNYNPYTPNNGGNLAEGQNSTISGGYSNTVSGNYATIAGGTCNTVSSYSGNSVIGGGYGNNIDNQVSVIAGGQTNTISGEYFSSILGGVDNKVTASNSVVVGGRCNCATDEYAFVGGGRNNKATGYSSVVVGGYKNTASGYYSIIESGYCNTASGNYSIVLGGYNNHAVGNNTGIFSGTNNSLSGINSFALGSNIVSNRPNTTFVNDLSATGSIYGSVQSSEIIGYGNELVISDGNDDTGNGASTLSLNFLSGVYVGSNLELTKPASSIVLQDPTGVRWTLTVNITGGLETALA